MSFLESVHSLIVGLELGDLFLILLDSPVEASLDLFDLTLEVGDLQFLGRLELLLLAEQTFLILHELRLALLLVLCVLELQLANLGLPRLALLSPCQGFLLSGDHPVGAIQKSLHFFLIGVLNGRLHGGVFLVLAMQMEDHLGQLGDLLRHFVVRFFVHLSLFCCFRFRLSLGRVSLSLFQMPLAWVAAGALFSCVAWF